MVDEAVTEAHEDANTGVVGGCGDEVFLQGGGFHPVGERVETGEEAEGWQAVVETLDKTADILSLFNEAEGGAKPDFANNIVDQVPTSESLLVCILYMIISGQRSTYTAHHEKSKVAPVLANFSLSLLSHCAMRASTNGSIFFILVKLYCTTSVSRHLSV